MKTRVSCIKCEKCGDTIYSRAHHDYHSCSCGNLSIDGGFEYVSIGWKSGEIPPEVFHKYIQATRQELYDDWNFRKDKFGKITDN